MRRSLPILFALAAVVAACEPTFAPSGSRFGSGNGSKGGGGGATVTTNVTNGGGAVPAGVHIFRVSASATDPGAPLPAIPDGPLDAYLWLISSNLGVAAMEFDLRHDGTEKAEHWFTAAPTNVGLTWEGGGEMDVAVGSCPMAHSLIGTFHLVPTGGDVWIQIVPGSQNAGTVPCNYDVIQEFQCMPLVRSE